MAESCVHLSGAVCWHSCTQQGCDEFFINFSSLEGADGAKILHISSRVSQAPSSLRLPL